MYKGDKYCFEQVLEVASHKTAAVRPIVYRLANYRSKTNKTCWRKKDEPIRKVLLWTPIHGHNSVDQLKIFVSSVRKLDAD